MKQRLILCLYFLFLGLVALYSFSRPNYNWDMLPYMAVAIGYDHADDRLVHDTVYRLARQQLPGAAYSELSDGGLEYRRKMAEDPSAFRQQMPFYLVKPLYTRLLYLFYLLGVPLIQAALLPSCIAYFLIGILLIFWVKRYLPILLSVIISSLIMVSAPMWEVLRTFSPDCLSAFFLLGACYMLLERKSLFLLIISLLLSVFTRLDNIIPALFFISLLAFSDKWAYAISVKKYLLILAIFLCAYLSISRNAIPYGWSILYYPTFLKWLNLSYSYMPAFHLRQYVSLTFSHILTGLFYSHFILFLLLSCLIFMRRGKELFKNLGTDQLLLCAIGLTILVRFVLQPNVADRFYIPFYLCILVMLIRKLYPIDAGVPSGR